MIHHCNSFITTKSFSLYVILIDLDEVLTRVPRGHTQCIPSANLPELIEPFNPFCCVQEILRLGISKTIYLYYQDIWYFKQTCLHSSFLAVCKNKAITASLGSLTLPIYNGKKKALVLLVVVLQSLFLLAIVENWALKFVLLVLCVILAGNI